MRIVLASVVAAVVLFFFGFIWWGVLMPSVRPAKVITDAEFVNAMSASMPESGVYFYPDYGEHPEEPIEPWAMLYFNKTAPAMGPMMGMGFGHMLLSALLASCGLSYLAEKSFSRRFAIVCFLGLFVALWADVGNMIWWRHPIGWTVFHFAYDVLSWGIAALIIAGIVKPDAEAV